MKISLLFAALSAVALADTGYDGGNNNWLDRRDSNGWVQDSDRKKDWDPKSDKDWDRKWDDKKDWDRKWDDKKDWDRKRDDKKDWDPRDSSDWARDGNRTRFTPTTWCPTSHHTSSHHTSHHTSSHHTSHHTSSHHTSHRTSSHHTSRCPTHHTSHCPTKHHSTKCHSSRYCPTKHHTKCHTSYCRPTTYCVTYWDRKEKKFCTKTETKFCEPCRDKKVYCPTGEVREQVNVAPVRVEPVKPVKCPPCEVKTITVHSPVRCNTVVVCNPILSNCPKPTGTVTLKLRR